MKGKTKLILDIILFFIIIIIGASIIGDILHLIIQDKINATIVYGIHIILIFILIEFLLRKTKPGQYINNKLFGRRKEK